MKPVLWRNWKDSNVLVVFFSVFLIFNFYWPILLIKFHGLTLRLAFIGRSEKLSTVLAKESFRAAVKTY